LGRPPTARGDGCFSERDHRQAGPTPRPAPAAGSGAFGGVSGAAQARFAAVPDDLGARPWRMAHTGV